MAKKETKNSVLPPIRISEEFKKKLYKAAEDNAMSVSDYILTLVNNDIKRMEEWKIGKRTHY